MSVAMMGVSQVEGNGVVKGILGTGDRVNRGLEAQHSLASGESRERDGVL